jgi:hypothetical protein
VDRLRCQHCDEIVGVYEPMRLLRPDGRDRHGSPLRLGDQLAVPGSTVVHERCYEAFDTEGRAEAAP